MDLGSAAKHYSDVADRVVGMGGKSHYSSQATLWRWRDAFQNDFAARMKWTVTEDPSSVNHQPVVMVNGSEGPEPLLLSIEAGEEVQLDASQTYDPDDDKLTFTWWQYKEPSIRPPAHVDVMVPDLDIVKVDDAQQPGSKVKFTLPPPEKCAIDFMSGEPLTEGLVFHIILEVKDDGVPALVTYKRVVIQVTNKQLRGRRGFPVETVTAWLEIGEKGSS